MRPYLGKTSWPFWISAPVNTTVPVPSVTCSGMGGAFVYVRTVTKDRTEKPAIITRMAECLHHGEILVASVDVSIMICPLQFLISIPGFQSFSQKAAMARSLHLPRRLRLTLTLEWKAQLQRPFPMPL